MSLNIEPRDIIFGYSYGYDEKNMGTNEIVTDIIDCFINEFKEENIIEEGFINKLEKLLHSNEKTTTQKIETLLYEENDKL